MITLPTDIVSLGLGSSNAQWLPKLGSNWQGFVYTYSWATSADDPRQVIRLNQFQAFLDDSNARGGWNVGEDYAYCPPYRWLVQPLAALLKAVSPAETTVYLDKVNEIRPHWWMPLADCFLGQEQGLMQPSDSYGMFLTHAWVKGTDAATLTRLAAFSWLTP